MLEWKTFYTYRNVVYQVSDCGSVRSLRKVVQSRYPSKSYTYRAKILSLVFQKRIKVDVANKRFDVADLVAQHFLPNPLCLSAVSFKDSNPLNCRASNLEWCDLASTALDEQWKDISGYDGKYQVSNLGNVRSLAFAKTRGYVRMLKPIMKSQGYYAVTLSGKQHLIHRLVAMCFCDNPHNYNVVDHINTIQTDNRAENLRWTTADGNIKNPLSHKKRMDRIMQTVPRKCVQMDLDGNRIRVWDSMKEACDSLGLHRGDLTNTCRGKYRTCGGYKWKYYDI